MDACPPRSDTAVRLGHSCQHSSLMDSPKGVKEVVVISPHEVGGRPVDYRIVIPTRGRWKPARCIANERKLKYVDTPFILVKTLKFLKNQRIPPKTVQLWTSDQEEKAHYEAALQQDSYWARETEVRVGMPGIMQQRNTIVKSFPEGQYIVSLDDDLGGVFWKHVPGKGQNTLVLLPSGALEKLIFHAYFLMQQHEARIWGLNTTNKNTMCMQTDGVSTRNGEINGYFYGFINRHKKSLLPALGDATEDAERSIRYFCE